MENVAQPMNIAVPEVFAWMLMAVRNFVFVIKVLIHDFAVVDTFLFAARLNIDLEANRQIGGIGRLFRWSRGGLLDTPYATAVFPDLRITVSVNCGRRNEFMALGLTSAHGEIKLNVFYRFKKNGFKATEHLYAST